MAAALAGLSGWRLARSHADAADPLGMEFEFLGCKGDWPVDEPIRASVSRQAEGSRVSFLVRDPVDCGLKVDKPSYQLSGPALQLSYEIHADGPVAACYCEYRSRYTFSRLPAQVKTVDFAHRDRP
ncbi:hypothetical protein [Pelomonas sp. KK5]|uniref:hypothetical protein n=1 Tax=Pelomonas sp. KK5 TaxID=1855730 RepID=UPI00097CB247|nr:hypothetical protein [Pelomonas sp. KK5]